MSRPETADPATAGCVRRRELGSSFARIDPLRDPLHQLAAPSWHGEIDCGRKSDDQNGNTLAEKRPMAGAIRHAAVIGRNADSQAEAHANHHHYHKAQAAILGIDVGPFADSPRIIRKFHVDRESVGLVIRASD